MQEHSPIVSVIIPTCNRERFIPRSLGSVLNQSFEDYEIIIVDDCSEDNTGEIVSKYDDKRIRYIRHKKRMGGSAARNTGIRNSNGLFIAFLDDDDEWLPEKLCLQIELFIKRPELGMVCTGYFYIDDITKKVLKKFSPEKKGFIYKDLLETNCLGTTSTAMIRKECFGRVGVFDEDLPACQDWDMWLRISKMFEIDFLGQPLVKFFIHKNRITRNIKAKIKGRKTILNKYYEDIKKCNKTLSGHHFIIGYLMCHHGDVFSGRKEIIKAIRLHRYDMGYYKYLFLSLLGASFYSKLLAIKTRITNIFV